MSKQTEIEATMKNTPPTEQEARELLPCPFCGRRPILMHSDSRCYYECVGCNGRTNETAPNEPVAARYWNERFDAGVLFARGQSVDAVLWCPNCFEQHIDEATPDVCEKCGELWADHQYTTEHSPCKEFKAWLNPPHKSHRCGFCNHVWRPAECPTNGVQSLSKQGENDQSAKPVAFASKKDFDDAVDYAIGFAHGQWIDVAEAEVSKSLQWLLIRNSNGEEGVRIGLREDGGWTIVNEFGQSQWVPGTLGVVAVMPLNVPKDGQFHLIPPSDDTQTVRDLERGVADVNRPCEIQGWSSRVCENGTRSCVIHHEKE